jgi:hypothetical protein
MIGLLPEAQSSVKDNSKFRMIGSKAMTLAIALFWACAYCQPAQSTVIENESPTPQVEKIPNVDHMLGNQESGDPGAATNSSDPLAEGTPAPTQSTNPASDPNAAPAPNVSASNIAPPSVPKPVAKAPVARETPISQINQVKLLYKLGKYRDALAVIAKMKPTELTHYYTGLCYQGQGQLSQAAQSFNYTASIAKDQAIRYNAQAAQRAVAAYARGRTYSGQGNSFARETYRGGSARGGSAGGGGGSGGGPAGGGGCTTGTA